MGEETSMSKIETSVGEAAEFYEKTLSSAEIYNGKIIHVSRDEVELPGGSHTVREVVSHNGGVGIVALDEEDNVLLVRQYRYPVGQELIEIPAGTLKKRGRPHGVRAPGTQGGNRRHSRTLYVAGIDSLLPRLLQSAALSLLGRGPLLRGAEAR